METRGPGRAFVGRDREMLELQAELSDVASPRVPMFLVSGEAGIGKSRLMDEFGRLAANTGWRVLEGRCWEAGGAPAYWPWIQIAREAGAEFEQVFRLHHAEGVPSSLDPDNIRFRLFESVARFLTDLSDQTPLVVILDDLHAADEPSLLLLQFVAM